MDAQPAAAAPDAPDGGRRGGFVDAADERVLLCAMSPPRTGANASIWRRALCQRDERKKWSSMAATATAQSAAVNVSVVGIMGSQVGNGKARWPPCVIGWNASGASEYRITRYCLHWCDTQVDGLVLCEWTLAVHNRSSVNPSVDAVGGLSRVNGQRPGSSLCLRWLGGLSSGLIRDRQLRL